MNEPSPTATILIVDDEKNIRRTLQMVLESEGYAVLVADSINAATSLVTSANGPDVIMLDIRLGEENGLDFLSQLGGGISPSSNPEESSADSSSNVAMASPLGRDIPVIVISGHASLEEAVRATKLGAFDFLQKPLERHRVVVSVRNAVEKRRILQKMNSLKAAVDSKFEILGGSSSVVALRRMIAKVAPTKSRVLITGESGTGKELIARAIHRNSALAQGPFIKVNCAAISPELIESELFGHEKGAFSGAIAKKRGLFEVADGGTLFLDEIGDMSLSAQAKVLRVLQTGEFSRVGGEQTLRSDCRVLAATNKNLEDAVKRGEFREDLFFRVNVMPIVSPPLRDRKDDIALLVRAFVDECCAENGVAAKTIDASVTARLMAYNWPGNIRELRNIVERLVILSEDCILESDLPPYLGGASRLPGESGQHRIMTGGSTSFAGKTLREFRDEAEADFIRQRLVECEWNISKTATTLGVERTNLHKKMRALGIVRE